MKSISLKAPYLIFVGDEARKPYLKTGAGLVQWRPELCKGQFRLSSDAVDLGIPDLTVEEAAVAGVGSLLIGTAVVGGELPLSWLAPLKEALEAGLDIVAGTHTPLSDIPILQKAAEKSGSRIIDVRRPPENIPVGTGKKRSGLRLLTVGDDCAVGKKYTALALEAALNAEGVSCDFRASGQTGIMIAGQGIPIDAVVCDFLVGAAELLSPDAPIDHWDIIEGQGGIFHPAYAPVSIGLLQGSQADAFVLCGEAGRTHFEGWPSVRLPAFQQVIDRTVALGQQTNPRIRCVGFSINTSRLNDRQRIDYLRHVEDTYALPAVDPLKTGVDAIVEKIRHDF